jgi:glycosyltransferase involved in cell wall biosynthesis
LRILWVKADKILPVHNGGNIRSYQIARHLALYHQLTFFSYYGGTLDPEYEEELGRQFPGAVCLCTEKPELTSLARGLDYLKNLPASTPYPVSRFGSTAVQERLSAWFSEKRFDLAVCDFLDGAVNFPVQSKAPTVLFQHNVESEIWRRHAQTTRNLAKRLLFRMEFSKMLRYEKSVVRQFDHVIAVSEHDRRLMSAWTNASQITVVPTGVDLHQYRPAPSPRLQDRLVVFVGAMDWEPNIDAVEYFCREIWPSILTKYPAARFRIVGRNPARRVRRLASDSVEITGSVPSVVDHLWESAVVVVPLRVGGGTRLKIYEAMAAGKAVVSTSIGAEGLDVHPNQDIVLADDPVAFAGAVMTLLQDANLRRKYEREAAAFAVKHDWATIAAEFRHLLERIVEAREPQSASEAELACEVSIRR